MFYFHSTLVGRLGLFSMMFGSRIWNDLWLEQQQAIHPSISNMPFSTPKTDPPLTLAYTIFSFSFSNPKINLHNSIQQLVVVTNSSSRWRCKMPHTWSWWIWFSLLYDCNLWLYSFSDLKIANIMILEVLNYDRKFLYKIDQWCAPSYKHLTVVNYNYRVVGTI